MPYASNEARAFFWYNVEMTGVKRNPEKTVIIFGVSGFVGSNLAEIFSSDYKVIGTYFKNKVSIPNVLTMPCNVLKKDETVSILFTFKPDIAIYCASVSSLLECSEDDESVKAVNTVGIFNVMDGCQRHHSQVCYISSCHVFSGKKKMYMETDILNANTFYGKNQSTVEFYLQKAGLNYTIFRVSKMYGLGLNPFHLNWFEYLKKMFSMKKHINCDNYIHIGFIDIYYLAMVLRMCFRENAVNRIFQVSSSDICTHYEFAKTYCEVFSGSDFAHLLQKGHWNFPFNDDTSDMQDGNLYYMLDLSNIEAFLSIKMPSIRESLEFTKKRLKVNERKYG